MMQGETSVDLLNKNGILILVQITAYLQPDVERSIMRDTSIDPVGHSKTPSHAQHLESSWYLLPVFLFHL